MRTTRFFCMLIGCGALLHGTSYAGPSASSSDQRSESPERSKQEKTADTKPAAPAEGEKPLPGLKPFGKKQTGGHVGAAKFLRKTVPINQKRPNANLAHQSRAGIGSGSALNVHAPGSSETAFANPKKLVEKKETTDRGPEMRASGVVPLGGAKFDAVHSRASETAAIGGPARSTAKSTASISGTSIRKHAY